MKATRRCVAASTAIAIALASAAHANSDRIKTAAVSVDSTQELEPREGGLDFGRNISFYTAVDSAALGPFSSGLEFTRGGPFRALNCDPSGSDNRAIGQFQLPHGVQMNFLRIWGIDENPNLGAEVTADLERTCLPDFGASAAHTSVLASATSAGASSHFSAAASIGGVLADNTSCTYRIVVTFGSDVAKCASMAFHKARIEWRRVTPPAPLSATFTDVPTSHGFFAFVEALAGANVTLGCTATEFCVDDPVTRGQMAAFLVRALSLQPSDLPDSANP